MRSIRYLVLALFAVGCSRETTLVLPDPPLIDKFTATPASVAKGAMVKLEWVTRNGDVEIVEVGSGPLPGIDRTDVDGSVDVQVDAQTLFVLNVTNSRGVKVTALATVTVEGSAQQVMFAALPNRIPAGGTATLVWTAPGARQVSITPMGGAALDLKGQVDTGSVQVSPSAATRYTLVADGTMATVEVGVEQAVTSFTASKSLAAAGEMVTLAWKTTNATKITLSRPGKGVIATETEPARVADGSATDTLAEFAAGTVVPYLLTIEGSGEPVTRRAEVVVGNQPLIDTFTGPEYAKIGAKLTLSWTTRNADAVEVATGGTVFYTTVTGAQAASGTLQLDTPASDTEYTLYAVNVRAGVRVSRPLMQKVIGAASVTTFTATPGTVANGGDAVTLSWSVPNARRLRITDSEGVTVASARGPTAATGTQVAYPNGATTYTLTADNTLDPAVTATANVTVTTPAPFGAPGTLLSGVPFDVSWSVGGAGAALQGSPTAALRVTPSSSGFVDISTTGTRLNFTSLDDAVVSFTPPDFETFLFGTRVTGTFTASTNGFIALAPTASARATPIAFPNATVERNFLAAWWLDLTLGATGAVYWQVLNEAPERTLVVQYDHVSAKAAVGSDLVFQIKVHQTGVVTYEYKTLANIGSASPTVAVQGPPNVAQVGPAPVAGSSTTFFGPNPSPVTVTATAPDAIGGFIKLTNGYLKVGFNPLTSFVAAGQLGISEAMYSPHPAIASLGEWVEISNRSPAPVDLDGWNLDFGDAGVLTIDAGLVVPAGGTVILGQAERDAGNDDVPTAFVYGPAFAMPDLAGTLSLYRSTYRSNVGWLSTDGGSGGVGVSVNIDPGPHLAIGDTSTTPLHPVVYSGQAAFGAQAPQQKGSPGTSAPAVMTMSSRPVSYFDISGSGTPVFAPTADLDENAAPVSLASAPFTFQGAPVSSITVNTNGWLMFKAYSCPGVGDCGWSNKTVPSAAAPSGGVLAVFWDDQEANPDLPNANVYSKRIAAGEDPANPGAHWIIQWHRYTHFLGTDDLNFQVKLFDTGVIEYHYATMTSGSSSNYGNGNSSTIWIENPSGQVALVSSVNKPVVVPNSAIRFTP